MEELPELLHKRAYIPIDSWHADAATRADAFKYYQHRQHVQANKAAAVHADNALMPSSLPRTVASLILSCRGDRRPTFLIGVCYTY
jgi:hypothetical protein